MPVTIAPISFLLMSCQTTVPAIDYCIHSSKFQKFYCTNSKTKERKELNYMEANKYISVSPDDYKKIIDFITEVTEQAGLSIFLFQKEIIEESFNEQAE